MKKVIDTGDKAPKPHYLLENAWAAQKLDLRVTFAKTQQAYDAKLKEFNAKLTVTLDEIGAALATLPDARTPTAADWARLARRWTPLLDARIAALTRLRDRLSGCIGCGCLSLQRCALYNPGDVAATHGAGARWLLGDRPPQPPATRAASRR